MLLNILYDLIWETLIYVTMVKTVIRVIDMIFKIEVVFFYDTFSYISEYILYVTVFKYACDIYKCKLQSVVFRLTFITTH